MAIRMRRFIVAGDKSGRSNRRTPFQVTIEAAERIDALKLDVTAERMATRPNNATQRGVAESSSKGSVAEGSVWRRVAFCGEKGYETAAIPINNGGIMKQTV